MISTLEYARNKAEIVLFQEPWINQNDFTTISHPSFLAIIPKPENPQINGSGTKIRVLTFIKKNIPVNITITLRLDIINDLDVQILSISGINLKEVLLFNIYNERNIDNIWTINRLTRIQLPKRAIISGDLNYYYS